MITMVTMVILTCYGFQLLKLEVSTVIFYEVIAKTV